MTIASKNYALYHLRIDAGLTQAEAATKMGVHRVTFCAWENGTVPIPARRYKAFVLLVGDVVAKVAATERSLPVRKPEALKPEPQAVPFDPYYGKSKEEFEARQASAERNEAERLARIAAKAAAKALEEGGGLV